MERQGLAGEFGSGRVSWGMLRYVASRLGRHVELRWVKSSYAEAGHVKYLFERRIEGWFTHGKTTAIKFQQM